MEDVNSPYQVPVENVPAQKVSLEGAPAYKVPLEGTPAYRVPVEEVPAEKVKAVLEKVKRMETAKPQSRGRTNIDELVDHLNGITYTGSIVSFH
nr:hypothetical transcript [Hymenolepis microstoma]